MGNLLSDISLTWFSAFILVRKLTIPCRQNDIAKQLTLSLQTKVNKEASLFSLAVDESTDIKDSAQLLVFIRSLSQRFDLCEDLLSILRNVGILVCSKPHLTLKDMLPKAKDSVERSSRPGVVYQIPCRDCSGIYIGKTKRVYKTRLAEHKRDLRPANLEKVNENNCNQKTALVKHVITKDHELTGIIVKF